MALKFESFDSAKHEREGFFCGSSPLDSYLKTRASQDVRRFVCTVFVLVEESEPRILGYSTLANYTVELQQLDSALAKKLPSYPRLPATLLGRLARHVDYRGRGFGELLLLDGLRRSLFAAQTQSGSVAVVVDAKDEEAMQFYLRYGFVCLGNHPLKLYLPMATVARLFI